MLPLTVGDIRKVLQDLPDNTLISYERVEDEYFDNLNWSVEKVPDSSLPGFHDEYIAAEVCWYDEPKNTLRISAHY